MKRSVGLILLAMVSFIGCLVYVPQGDYGSPEASPATPPPQGDQVDNQWNYDNPDVSDYYSYLGSTGAWVSYPAYGYVWIPGGMGYGWRPYCLGQWAWTDYGWNWVSTEPWGWLVYHYGRWGWDGRLGWFWVPGNVWAPAWVAWRWGDAYIGWAPLPPGDDFSMAYGFRRRNFNIPGDYWCFVRGQQFMDPRLDRWIVPRERNVSIINDTRMDVNIHVRDNRVFNDGVDANYVQQRTNRTVERYALTDARRPGEAQIGARSVSVYRPTFRPSQNARPRQVMSPDQAAARRSQSSRPAAGAGLDEELAVRQQHQVEMQRLNEDQQAEVRTIQQKADAERSALRTPAERERAAAATKSRLADVQKRQAGEKAQMAQRHKTEEDQARRNKLEEREALGRTAGPRRGDERRGQD